MYAKEREKTFQIKETEQNKSMQGWVQAWICGGWLGVWAD